MVLPVCMFCATYAAQYAFSFKNCHRKKRISNADDVVKEEVKDYKIRLLFTQKQFYLKHKVECQIWKGFQ
jgi:hypothetical protein